MLIRETELRLQIRSLLKEAELKHSEEFVQKIYEFYSKWKDYDFKGQTATKELEIPAEQIIYPKNQIKTGFILYRFLNQQNANISVGVNLLKGAFDPSKFLIMNDEEEFSLGNLKISAKVSSIPPKNGSITQGTFYIQDKPVILLNAYEKEAKKKLKQQLDMSFNI